MKKIPKWTKGLFFLFGFYVLFFLKLPYYIEVPGSVFSLDEMTEVDNKFTDTPGGFYITTVGIRKASPAGLLSSVLPYHDVLRAVDLYGESNDFESYDKIQKYNMKSSINNAIKVAFDAADKEYQFEYKGIYVLQVIEESSFYNQLKIGDTVQSVDGNTFQSSQEFITYIEDKRVDDEVVLKIEREEEEIELFGKLIQLESGVAGIGIGLVDDTKLITDPNVVIHSANIGGPSAGLMFSLDVYTKLIESNLRGNYNIAGTGTIEADGKVGRIGGIEKKIVAADREGIDYFFAPNDEIQEELEEINPGIQSNYEAAITTAKAIDTEMEIIPVQTIDDAINFLEKLQLEENKQRSANIIDLSVLNKNPALERLVAISKK